MRDPIRAKMRKTDAKSAISICPASQDELFIVPARYAMAESKAQHSCFNPAAETQSHPMALRKLRAGYLYLWHEQGPLKRYAVAADGRLQPQGLDEPHSEVASAALAGIALDKEHDAWLLYTEMPMAAASYQQLEDPQQRTSRMRKIALTEVALSLEAPHCPPLEKADELVAELMPEVRNKALAADQQQNGETYQQGIDQLGQRMMDNPTFDNTKAYTEAMLWQRERQTAAANHSDASENQPGEWSAVPWDVAQTDAWVEQAEGQAGALWPVFAAVDDDLGVLRDLNFEQAQVGKREEEWDHQNAHKGMIAGFINSLIKEDGAELSNLLNYRYRDRDIQLTPEQGDALLRAKHQLAPLFAEESQINQRERLQIGHAAADLRIADIKRREEQVLAPTRVFIPVDLQGQLQDVVMAYQANKVHNMSDAKSSAQVAERVQLSRMQQWISQVAEPHQQWLIARRDMLYTDTGSYLARHGDALWYADYDDQDHCTWLSELALNSLSELCSAGPGVEIATNLLRAPSATAPFSLLVSGFSPSLMDLADRSTQVDAALTSANQAAVGQLVSSLVAAGKYTWLSDLGGPNGNDWAMAVSRLSAAFAALEVEHLASTPNPSNLIQRFPDPLRAMLVIMRLTTDSAINLGSAGFSMTGVTGQRLWDWGQQAGRSLQKGLAPAANNIRSLKTLGGVLPLAALLLHINNVQIITQRDQGRANDDVRSREHTAENLKVGAALSAVIGAAWEATGQVEVSKFGLKAPIVTLFGAITGGLATFASIADLTKFAAEMQKDGAYWTADHWARLSHDSAILGLMGAQTGLGGYATYMAITAQWTTEEAIKWFTLRITPVNWLLLVVEGLYLAWNYFKDTELQAFVEQCCWGNQRRWGDDPASQNAEMQTLIDLLFKPKLQASGHLTSRQIGRGDNSTVLENHADTLQLFLPGADPDRTQLFINLTAFDELNTPTDITLQWLANAQCQWLPIHQGMGLSLTGAIAPTFNARYWQMRVMYHSPMGMQSGTLNPQKLLVGGGMGMRYIVKGTHVVEHGLTDGRLTSDGFSAIEVPKRLLQPRDNT